MNEKEKLAEKIKAYHEGSDFEGQAKIEMQMERLEKAEQDYMMTTHATQVNEHRLLLGGMATDINPDIGLAPVRQEYLKQIDKTAREHNYTGPVLYDEEPQETDEPNESLSNKPALPDETGAQEPRQVRMNEFLQTLQSIKKPSDGPKLI